MKPEEVMARAFNEKMTNTPVSTREVVNYQISALREAGLVIVSRGDLDIAHLIALQSGNHRLAGVIDGMIAAADTIAPPETK